MIRARRPLSGRLWSKTPHWSELRPAEQAAGVENSASVGNSRKTRTRTRTRKLLVAALVVFVATLAGCVESPALTGPAAPDASPTEVVPTSESTADLAGMKKAAGIADCPKSNPDVAAV